MNTNQLTELMNNYECFKGVYPIDLIENLNFNERPIAIIINLDPSHLPGSHWVSLFIDQNNIAEYFDSFGFPNFSKELLKLLRNHNIRKIIFNKYMLQSTDSSSCGAYCVMFLKMRCRSFSLNEFLKLFSNRTSQNDLMALKILE